MFKYKISINQDIVNTLRELPTRAKRNLRHRLVTELRDELQQDTDDLMDQGPARVDPFEFNTDKSKRFYHALVDANPGLSDGEHWIRSGITEHGFRVSVSDRLRENLISIRNIQESPIPGGKFPLVQRYRGSFVYGKRYVLGHIATGFPDQAEIAMQLLKEKAISRIIDFWYESVRAAAKGRDL